MLSAPSGRVSPYTVTRSASGTVKGDAAASAQRTLDGPAILRGTVYGDTLPDGAESTSPAGARRGSGGKAPS